MFWEENINQEITKKRAGSFINSLIKQLSISSVTSYVYGYVLCQWILIRLFNDTTSRSVNNSTLTSPVTFLFYGMVLIVN